MATAALEEFVADFVFEGKQVAWTQDIMDVLDGSDVTVGCIGIAAGLRWVRVAGAGAARFRRGRGAPLGRA